MRMMITTKFLQSVLVLILLVINIYGGRGHSNFAGNNGAKCGERERMALLKFKVELIDDYGRLSSWGSTNCCEWEGVVCDNRTNHVIALDLHGDPVPLLRGKISPSLLQLPHLQYLDLSFNYFSGTTIPKFIGSLTKLHHLNLSYSNFVGPIPHHIGNLSVLRVLDLGCNSELTDSNLDWLSGSPSLEYLDLSGVSLERCTTWLQPIHKLTALKQLHLPYCSLPIIVEPISLSSHNSSNSLVVLDLSSNNFFSSTAVLLSWFLNMSSSFTYIDLSENALEVEGKNSIPDALGNLMSLSHLDLHFNNFGSNIHNALGNLTSLSYLDLSYNQLHGEFPRPCRNSTSLLTHLDLSWNNLNGKLHHLMTWLHDSTRLKYVSLRDNELGGSFPNMSGFSLLKELHLQNNLLNGSLVQAHLRLPNLEYLDLSINKFTGTLPNLSSCPSLRVIYLSDNTFNVILKESIGNLSRLVEFDVGYNQLEGVITEAHLSSLPQLTELDLSFNLNVTLRITPSWKHNVQFHVLKLANCKLGPQFPKWLQKQNQLEFLDISNSGIFDTIPGWFWGNMYVCYNLNMSHNQIYGVLPNLSAKFSILVTIDLSFNEFTGSLPHLPPVLISIGLSTNKFSGTIHHFCNFEHLHDVLDLSNNLLSGDIPQGCFVIFSSLRYLNLANNNFSGEIPTTNSACRLSLLHLQNNSFKGEIPRSLMNCSELRILDLGQNEFSGEIPGWLGKSMPKLGVLILKSNILYGSLPSSICHLANLQVLDISSNKITGTVPNCVNNFTLLSSDVYSEYWNNPFIASRNDSNFYDSASVNWKGKEEIYINTLALLKMIDLSSNELTGEIPRELTSLIGLLGLNLSRNNLVGFIPDDIDQMKLLNFLDLSRNKLSGGIPPTISKLSHLGVLNLSFNNLSGRIPWDTHMQTFGASTYLGNPRLCGLPLLRRPCPEAEKPSNGRDIDSEDEDDTFITKGFYTSMMLGFFVAFWVVFWTLFFNKWWNASTRKIYVMVSDWLYVQILVNKRRLLSYFSNA
ncbi:hypothetical protein C2S52_010225 [Perilla frutescens var. hirtella]|nr:hypothetical protein C2S52_010225 [Perilla frutescens var. hirtella]